MVLKSHTTEPFALHGRLPASAYEGERPTVVAVLRSQGGEVLMVLPQKAGKHATNAWMFPQGPIERYLSPYQAFDQLLQDECCLASSDVEPDSVRALCTAFSQTASGLKRYFVLFGTLRPGVRPVVKLSDEKDVHPKTREVFFASGPNCVWSKIGDDRQAKRQMIVQVLEMAVRKRLLVNDRWSPERFAPFLTHAGH